MRYMKDYAIPYAKRSGDLNHVPRAAYAVYNAGPRAVGRFDKPRPHPREKRVDERLWTLYQGIASGGRADLRTCGVNTGAAVRHSAHTVSVVRNASASSAGVLPAPSRSGKPRKRIYD
jgi:hypothetical protein